MRKSGRNEVRAKIASTRGRKEAKRKREGEKNVYSVTISIHTYT